MATASQPAADEKVSEGSYLLQAQAFLRRWRSRKGKASAGPTTDIPHQVALPQTAANDYRAYAWVLYEQRIFLAVLTALTGTVASVWAIALQVEKRPPVVVRAPASLKEAAAEFYGTPQISYDQLAFFLHGALPLLFASDDGGHPLLPLAQGLVSPEIFTAAERRLDGDVSEVKANAMTQMLTLTGVADVAVDEKSGRAAAYVRGYVTVTVKNLGVTHFPWRGQVLVQANAISRLNPYPFYLQRLEWKLGPDALTWDQSHAGTSLLDD